MDVIYSYTRAQALADGVLIDVTEMAREAGIRLPTALTQGAWDSHVRVPSGVTGQDEKGRLWDVLWMFRMENRWLPVDLCADMILYRLLVRNDDGDPKEVTLKAISGPGDNWEPVITIMLPDED